MWIFKNKRTETVDYRSHFEVGDAIKLVYRGKYHTSRVAELWIDGLWITCPPAIEVDLPAEEIPLTVVSSVRSGMQGFRVRVEGREEGPVALLRVVPMESLGKIQRRTHARIPDGVPVRFKLFNPSYDPTFEDEGPFTETTTLNISGQGVLMLVEEADRPRVGDTLALELQLPKGETVRAKASVTRLEKAGGPKGKYRMGLHFREIQEQDRKRIIRRVFAREAELHNAGLL